MPTIKDVAAEAGDERKSIFCHGKAELYAKRNGEKFIPAEE